MTPIPLMLFSDAVSAPSGLARISRELLTRIQQNMPDVFRVCSIGYGGSSSTKIPWHQYSWQYSDDWVIHDLPEIWHDFAGEQKGIFLTIQDAGRMFWLARPETCSDGVVQRFLRRKPFQKWGYFPIDATGPRDRLSGTLRGCLLGYDRVLAYTKWAESVLLRTLGMSAADDLQLHSIPHGIDTSIFYPRGRKWRQMFGTLTVGKKASIADDETLIGIVATNQFRKDFGLGFEVVSALSKTRKVRLWIHTDSFDRHWAIPYLFSDFELTGDEHILSAGCLDDETMAKLYSSCDLTLGIGNGEGWGLPLGESLACGTPVIHGNYGGGACFVPKTMLVEPVASRLEGVYSCRRMVYRAEDWVKVALEALPLKSDESLLPEWCDWQGPTLWNEWKKWLLRGVRDVESGPSPVEAGSSRLTELEVPHDSPTQR
jgi:glycosyltransferase involved in cell wall biosynthesis